jgi:hypothetical protein
MGITVPPMSQRSVVPVARTHAPPEPAERTAATELMNAARPAPEAPPREVPLVALPPPRPAAREPVAWWMPWLLTGGALSALTIVVLLLAVVAFRQPERPVVVLPPPPSPVPVPVMVPVPVVPADLSVKSRPSGAAVWVGQERIGTTPLTFAPAAADGTELSLRLTMEGYEPRSVTVTLPHTDPIEVRLDKVPEEPQPDLRER